MFSKIITNVANKPDIHISQGSEICIPIAILLCCKLCMHVARGCIQTGKAVKLELHYVILEKISSNKNCILTNKQLAEKLLIIKCHLK